MPQVKGPVWVRRQKKVRERGTDHSLSWDFSRKGKAGKGKQFRIT